MKAIIVAAGKGSRLKINKPKGLLNIGNKHLIEYSIDALLQYVTEIIVCVGYEHEQYFFLSQKYPVEFVLNPDYDSTGSLYTLYCARGAVHEDALVLDSDILYDPWCLGEVVKRENEDVILTSKTNGMGDDMYVHSQGGVVSRLTKNVYSDNVLVGITKLRHDTLTKLWDYCEDRFKTDKCDHHDVVFPYVANFHVLHIAELVYTEIDNDEQLAYAVTIVQPKIGLVPTRSNASSRLPHLKI